MAMLFMPRRALDNRVAVVLVLLVLFCSLGHGEATLSLRILLEAKASFVEEDPRVLSGWSPSNPNFCTWTGVSCDQLQQQVVALNLSASSLLGLISPSLGLLRNLLHLDLSSNSLTGPIPPALSNLSSLQSRLFSNQLSGAIPPQLGSLSSLRVLRLGDNPALTGPIPPSLGGLASLVTLGLASCSLTVPIPPQLGQLPLLQNLILQQNQLTGPIPPERGNCSSLMQFTAALNGLSGSIPRELGRLGNLGLLNPRMMLLETWRIFFPLRGLSARETLYSTTKRRRLVRHQESQNPPTHEARWEEGQPR
ncbi:LRR receptor-like serine/threonine-protein kinase GSO1 [Rhodamnia argentea]|uniref:LRR receptor-like serine/threonine-protein kinase GSO1 n=1 Tax=Rhodamnia argentea TaxID=178133 RepID=A0A8B8QWD8_9MYRT|nr:LRR receptor-like serine/threonine-protein kinase GSO1 [Rhodamnia argentea]